jgi:hypothetical protein
MRNQYRRIESLFIMADIFKKFEFEKENSGV